MEIFGFFIEKVAEGAYCVGFEDMSFPVGTTFDSPEKAIVSSVKLVNDYTSISKNSISNLNSAKKEEFVSNERMNKLFKDSCCNLAQ